MDARSYGAAGATSLQSHNPRTTLAPSGATYSARGHARPTKNDSAPTELENLLPGFSANMPALTGLENWRSSAPVRGYYLRA